MLPPLRQDLILHAAAPLDDGSPHWVLHDPARNKFFQIGWPVFEILSRWSLGDAELILKDVSRETTLRLDLDIFEDVFTFLVEHELVQPSSPQATERFLKSHNAQVQSFWTWVLHHYLFFRIPLLRPDALLSKILPYVQWIYSRAFMAMTAIAFVLGLFLVNRQWDMFLVSISQTFSLAGALSYFCALSIAKSCHELGHAITAKRMNCRIPAIGVAFIVMVPVLYTDTTDVWKLPNRFDRLRVSIAGMITELTIAIWATLAWTLLPDGVLRWSALILATSTWVTSIIINASPFMRFDGYYILSDALAIPNLHIRSFALARWWLRELLFNLGHQPPEFFPRPKHIFLIAFALFVWLYRLAVFLGIALLVYHFFIKIVGVMLFAVEIGWFVLLPFVHEFQTWWSIRTLIINSQRARYTVLGVFVVLCVFIVPWHTNISGPALLRAAEQSDIYAPSLGQIKGIYIHNGSIVRQGDILLELQSPDLQYKLDDARHRVASLDYQVRASSFDASFLVQNHVLREQLESAKSEWQGLLIETNKLAIAAPFSGEVRDLDPNLSEGQWIARKQPLCIIADTHHLNAVVFLTAEQILRVHIGDKAQFFAESNPSVALKGHIIRIDELPQRSLDVDILASTFGGPIETHQKDKQQIPVASVYQIIVDFDQVSDYAHGHVMRGVVNIDGSAESLLTSFWHAAAAVLIREIGM
jgi:putative peptide zinc metalloprotease protein